MDNILDTSPHCNTDEFDLMVLHGPTWAVPYKWDEDAESIVDQCVKENWRKRPRGRILHVVPEYLAGD
jgi:hypothetical protein